MTSFPKIVDGALGGALRLGSRYIAVLNRIGAKRPVTRVATLAHVRLYERSRGRLGTEAGAPTLLLTTTGRKSGRPRTVALYYLPDGDRQILVGSYGGDDEHPLWYSNLVAEPSATVQLGSEVWPVRAREATGAERAELWPCVVENWPSYANYQTLTERVLPVVVLERVAYEGSGSSIGEAATSADTRTSRR